MLNVKLFESYSNEAYSLGNTFCNFSISCHFRRTQHHSNLLTFNTNGISKRKSEETKFSLYPYHSFQLSIVFVYGTDLKRQKFHQLFSVEGEEIYQLTGLFSTVAAAVLCFLRRKYRLKRDGYLSSMFDVQIAFIGGGNLRMRHKLERWFFGILLIGTFFYMTFWQEAVLFQSFLISDQSIDTFNELVEINPPVFSFLVSKKNEERIIEMLRFVRKQIFAMFYIDRFCPFSDEKLAKMLTFQASD